MSGSGPGPGPDSRTATPARFERDARRKPARSANTCMNGRREAVPALPAGRPVRDVPRQTSRRTTTGASPVVRTTKLTEMSSPQHLGPPTRQKTNNRGSPEDPARHPARPDRTPSHPASQSPVPEDPGKVTITLAKGRPLHGATSGRRGRHPLAVRGQKNSPHNGIDTASAGLGVSADAADPRLAAPAADEPVRGVSRADLNGSR